MVAAKFFEVKRNVQHVMECPHCEAHVVVDYNGPDPIVWGVPVEPDGNVYACPSCGKHAQLDVETA